MHRVLEGFRREVTAEERCRRADIEPNKLYSRTEGFMGQASSVRVETWSEPPLYGIDRLEWQSADLKDLVAELSLDLHRLKKTSIPSLCEGVANARASPRRLRSSRRLSHPRAPSARFYQSLESKNDCYRWRARARQGSLEDRRHPGPSWNRLSPQEESVVLDVSLEHTDLSSSQLAAWITDNKGFSVSESSVYRLLNSQGLVKSPEMKMATGQAPIRSLLT